MHVVQLAVDVTCEVDCSPYLERNLAAQLPPDRSYDYSHNLSLCLKGTGTLWQSTTASGPSSLQLDLDVEGKESFQASTDLDNKTTGGRGALNLRIDSGWKGQCHIALEDLAPSH